MTESSCYVIVYEDPENPVWGVLAVFTDEELAKSELHKYQVEDTEHCVKIEKYSLDKVSQDAPEGMKAFTCWGERKVGGKMLTSISCFEVMTATMSSPDKDIHVTVRNGIENLRVSVWARDEEDAKKIARKKFNEVVRGEVQ